MTTAIRPVDSSPEAAVPVLDQLAPDSALRESEVNDSPWNAGAEEDLQEVHTDHAPTGHESAGSRSDRASGHHASRTAADQISPPDVTSARSHSHPNANSGSLGKRCEFSYLHCCTAASIGLIVLSVACFVAPSISTYAAERGTVQALGYTAGVISLLSGLTAGACVVSVHRKSGDWRN